jgi:hypothetical protein
MAVREPMAKPVEEPTWAIAKLFPNQGEWSEEDYLTLNTNRLVEFFNGHVEVPDMPTPSHQFLALYLYESFSRCPIGRYHLLATSAIMHW